jgi:RNA polymerase sigma factor (sigma-70 family)
MNASELERLLATTQHLSRIEAIARKNTRGTPVYWEDAVQVAQIKLLHAVRAGKFVGGDATRFYHWATKVAKYEIIDLVRKEIRQSPQISLDQPIADTELTRLDTLADGTNLFSSLETADLVLKIMDLLIDLDLAHPQKHYRQICLGQASGKTQVELARELGITQSLVSKRMKELSFLVDDALHLGLFSLEAVKREHQNLRQSQHHRHRSSAKW